MEEKKMTVKEFVDFYRKLKSNKEAAWDAVGLLHYVPFKLKADTALNVIQDNFNLDDGMITKNTPALYVLNRMCAVTIYCPNLIISEDDALYDYDLLNSTGILKDILNAIGEDINEFDAIFNMTFDDFISNNTSAGAYIHKILSTLTNIGNTAINSILENLDHANVKDILSILSATSDDGK